MSIFLVKDKDGTESGLRVIAEGIEHLRQFVSEKVYNELFSPLKCYVKHHKRIFLRTTASRRFKSI